MKAGRVNKKSMPIPGQAHVVTNNATISSVYGLIQKNRLITTHKIAVELSISEGRVLTIIHKNLAYSKVCAMWVPMNQSGSQKTVIMGVYMIKLLE